MGCEVLLKKDFNICTNCYESKAYVVSQAPFSNAGHRAKLCESAKKKSKSQARCACKQRRCVQCGFCIACACECHTKFQTRYRFHSARELVESWHDVRRATA